jgi:acylphosphatase
MATAAILRALQIRVSGRVQGVSFRYYTREQALQEDLSGWVRNLANGDVDVWLQSDDEQALARMLQWLQHGPSLARVDRIEHSACAPDATLQGFEIRF